MYLDFIKAKSIKPQGWLLKQLQTQANGLNGNLDKVWRDVRDNSWLGGQYDGWERLPYFLDGFIPLAYLLRDEDKIARATKYINGLLDRQADDGCFYPKGAEGTNGDIWAIFLILKVLTVYADCSGESERIENAIYKCLQFLNKHIDTNPPFKWAAARWYECIISISWVYKRRKEDWLIYLARRLKTLGFNFEAAIELWKEKRPIWGFDSHVVNVAMALKSEAVYCEITGDKPTGLAERMLEVLEKYHSTAYGHFTGDECFSGDSPIQGSELCGIVEAMYSYEWLMACTGESKWGDRLERLAFNALPATITTDMWAHQYDQQVNQISSMVYAQDKNIFPTNASDANVFGLEPNYGCCTANFGQGFPKFALSSYMEKDGKLYVISPMPMRITMQNGVEVVCKSEYPFRALFTFTTTMDTEIFVRVPSWTNPVFENGEMENGWLKLIVKKGVETAVSFPATVELTERPNGAKCLNYGALLFSLPIAGDKKIVEYERNGVIRKFPYCDYEIKPVGEWRYAFAGSKFTVEERGYDLPFDRDNPPIVIKGEFAPVEWDYEKGYEFIADKTVGSKRRGENVTLAMQPYGSTELRITEMCLLEKNEK